LTGDDTIRGITESSKMLDKIISGGQTGADQAAWRAAKAYGVSTGGWMPEGFLTEDGPRPEFAEGFGAAELAGAGDPTPHEQNTKNSDATLWFGDTTTADAHATVITCQRLGKPCMLVYPGATFEPSHVVAWIAQNTIRTLNVAGNRDTEESGIGDRLERFLGHVLQQLGHQRI
jgi:hypothetical protein